MERQMARQKNCREKHIEIDIRQCLPRHSHHCAKKLLKEMDKWAENEQKYRVDKFEKKTPGKF